MIQPAVSYLNHVAIAMDKIFYTFIMETYSRIRDILSHIILELLLFSTGIEHAYYDGDIDFKYINDFEDKK
jgi:hypothetical protein